MPRLLDEERAAIRPDRYAGAHDDMGTISDDQAQEVGDVEQAHSRGVDRGENNTGASLNDQEEADPPTNDKLGRGWTGREKRRRKGVFRGLLKPLGAKLIGGFLGGGLLASVLAFLLMLPLKIVSVDYLVSRFTSVSFAEPMEIVNRRLLTGYLNTVANSIDKGVCKSTVRPDCVVLPSKRTGPVGKLYATWRQNRLENRLAKRGIILDRDASGVFMTVGDVRVTEDSLRRMRAGEIDVSELEGRQRASSTKVYSAIDKALEGETRWKALYLRYVLGPGIERTWGAKRCTFACNYREPFRQAVKDKKVAGKLFIAQLLGSMMSENNSLVLQCIISPQDCDTALKPSGDGKPPKSQFHEKLHTQLDAFRNNQGSRSLSEILSKAEDVNKIGIPAYIARETSVKLGRLLGKEVTGEAAEMAMGKAIPVIGWISLGLSVLEAAEKTPQTIKYMTYAMNVAEAVQYYSIYRSAVAEQKEGKTDAAVIGSLSDQLSEGPEITAAPMYPEVTGGSRTQASVYEKLLDYAYAPAGAETSTSGYRCEDGKLLAKGKLGCPEENFASAGAFIDITSGIANGSVIKDLNPVKSVNSLLDSLMSMAKLNRDILYGVNHIYGFIVSAGGVVGTVLTASCQVRPDCAFMMQFGTEKMMEFFTWLRDNLLPHPVKFASKSGARAFQMMLAGSMAIDNKSAQEDLGAAEISPRAFAEMQQRRIAKEKQEFQSLPLYARVFDKDSSYSLVTQVSLDAPSRDGVFASTIASLLDSPARKFSDVLAAGITREGSAFAYQASGKNPFGIKMNSYKPSQVPKNPEKYWAENCEGRDFKKEWFDSMVQDPETGEPKATRVEPCMLIEKGVNSLGGMYDSSFNETASEDSTETIGDLPSKDGFVWPIVGANKGSVTQKWNVYNATRGGLHKGIDIRGSIGTRVLAAHDGTVVATSGGCNGSYLISIDGSSFYMGYQHLKEPVPLKVGDAVKAGQIIGTLGPVGSCGSAPHLHFSIERTKHISVYADSIDKSDDPLKYLP